MRVVLRALALLQLAGGQSPPQVARNLGLTAKAVRALGWRYQQEGRERALDEKPRPGAVPRLEARQRQRVIALGYSDPLRPLDHSVNCAGGGQKEVGAESRAGDHSGASPKPRLEAVAGKRCGAWPTWMKST